MNFASGEIARRVIPFSNAVMMSAPKITPHTVPRPPLRAVPPITQAAMASSSIKSPTVVVDEPE